MIVNIKLPSFTIKCKGVKVLKGENVCKKCKVIFHHICTNIHFVLNTTHAQKLYLHSYST